MSAVYIHDCLNWCGAAADGWWVEEEPITQVWLLILCMQWSSDSVLGSQIVGCAERWLEVIFRCCCDIQSARWLTGPSMCFWVWSTLTRSVIQPVGLDLCCWSVNTEVTAELRLSTSSVDRQAASAASAAPHKHGSVCVRRVHLLLLSISWSAD